jgi:hypothetical protein
MTHKAGRTTPGVPYVMRYTDGYGNLCTRDVERPDVISTFFQDSNVIDTHNQCRQHNLALEKKWLTKDAYFRLATTLIGINVVDCYRLADFHQFINYTKKNIEKKMTIVRFAGILGYQLIQNSARLSNVESRFLSTVPEDCNLITVPTNITDSTLSSISGEAVLSCAPIRSEMDVNNMIHHLVKLPLKVDKSGRKRCLSRPCKLCKEQGIRHDVTVYCLTCGESSNYCNDTGRDCFLQHVKSIRRTTRSSTR